MELDRLMGYAYFHGVVKGFTEGVSKGYITPLEAIEALRAAVVDLERKLKTADIPVDETAVGR